jgi:hypothetical protein
MIDRAILGLRRLPARLDADQVATVLGFQPYEIPILVRSNLLRPLGRPAPNGHKYFCAAEVEEFSRDKAWLDRATKTVASHFQNKNRATTAPDVAA